MIYITELSYSLHLGSDKNKKNNARKSAKSNTSGSTSLSNNAIQNARQLSRVDNHNYRKYDNKQEDILIIRGTSSLVEDVKKLYIEEFEGAKEEYNSKQTRENRKIDNYFKNVSDNSKNDLACEIIIELGDKKYWDTKDMNFKKRMTSVYTKQVEDLETLLPEFKVASAIIHYDETSPHMHIVGVPIKYKNKYGMSKQVGKSSVFTKESLKVLQDKMRILCIESFNKEYKLNNTLKKKLKGRNIDINVSEMDNYNNIKKTFEQNKVKLEKANKKSLELDNISKDVRYKINSLKQSKFNKDNFILSRDDKDKLISYIEQVDNTNKEYKNIKKLSVMLNEVEDELKNNKEQIETLNENNKALDLRVQTLNKNIEKKDKKITELKNEVSKLSRTLEYWKDKFFRVITLIKNKLLGRKSTREAYMEVAEDMHNVGIIDDGNFKECKAHYNISKRYDANESKEKEKDRDFSL